MQATQLELGEVIEMREDSGRIVIDRVTPKRYDLSELLKGITNKNKHRAIDFGPAVDARSCVSLSQPMEIASLAFPEIT
jgi:antitoxin MazE